MQYPLLCVVVQLSQPDWDVPQRKTEDKTEQKTNVITKDRKRVDFFAVGY